MQAVISTHHSIVMNNLCFIPSFYGKNLMNMVMCIKNEQELQQQQIIINK